MTTDPRIAVLSALSSPDWHPVPEAHGMPWDEAEQLLAAYDASRAAAPSTPADVFTAADLVAALRAAGAERDRIEAKARTADRAAVYAEVADRLAADAEQGAKEGFTRIYRRSAAKQVREWGDELRRMAAEAVQQPEADAVDASPVCGGFQWIGQSFATCDRCGQPAWEHAGEEVPVEGAGPFDNRRTVRPWTPGQADRIRAKWGTPAAVQQPKEA